LNDLQSPGNIGLFFTRA